MSILKHRCRVAKSSHLKIAYKSVLVILDTLQNMAEGSPAWQSSSLVETDSAHRVVDGIDNPSHYAGSCSHTKYTAITKPPVWAVDLGHLTDVYYVEVVNRNELAGKLLWIIWNTCFTDTDSIVRFITFPTAWKR